MANRFYFLFFGLIGTIGLLAQFIYFPDLIDYLSLFTILSNILAATIFLYLGIKGRNKYSKSISLLLGASTTYIILTSIGYWLFLRDEPVAIPWINIVLHLVMPIAVIAGWLIHNHSNRLKYTDVLKWLIFPLIYLVYSILRDVFTDWSPYPFLNPDKVGGYGGVFMYVVVFSIVTCLVGAGIIFINNKLSR